MQSVATEVQGQEGHASQSRVDLLHPQPNPSLNMYIDKGRQTKYNKRMDGRSSPISHEKVSNGETLNSRPYKDVTKQHPRCLQHWDIF
jgi:hypothetical protein